MNNLFVKKVCCLSSAFCRVSFRVFRKGYLFLAEDFQTWTFGSFVSRQKNIKSEKQSLFVDAVASTSSATYSFITRCLSVVEGTFSLLISVPEPVEGTFLFLPVISTPLNHRIIYYYTRCLSLSKAHSHFSSRCLSLSKAHYFYCIKNPCTL